ncbi:tail fiber domain-containing protein [Pigmentiphaga soli]
MFQQLQERLKPFVDAGAGTGLQGLLGMLGVGPGVGNSNAMSSYLTTPFQFDASKLDQTPGYQFTLQQGLKALNNQASAQGMGLSGAQSKGLLNFATGLANQTYGDQYNRALQQFQANYGLASDQFNRFSGLAGLGQNAAAGVGNAGMQTASNIGNLAQQGAAAQGSGLIGAANANASTLGNLGNLGMSAAGIYALLSDMRTKEDIEPIGRTKKGHTLYRYRYKGDPTLQIGVMAQEVEQADPDAVIEINGVKYVDYSKVH